MKNTKNKTLILICSVCLLVNNLNVVNALVKKLPRVLSGAIRAILKILMSKKGGVPCI